MKQVFKCSHISVTHLLSGPAEREAGTWKPHLYEWKDTQLDTAYQGLKNNDTILQVTFHIYLLQRTACLHTAKLPYCHQQGYIQTASWKQSLACAAQSIAGKGADQPRAVP